MLAGRRAAAGRLQEWRNWPNAAGHGAEMLETNDALPAAQVDVDVYRSLGAKRSEPLPGAASFFQVQPPSD